LETATFVFDCISCDVSCDISWSISSRISSSDCLLKNVKMTRSVFTWPV
jgi:hypothetical protein